jgi:site-specific DNA-methyltransferase (adenine-specific)
VPSPAEEHAAAPEADRREGNVHATIKPIGCGQDDGLMRWLVRLVTPEGGPVLDGMMGSGSTGVAAQIEGCDFFGCDIDPGAVAIAEARMAFWTPERHRSALRDKSTPKVATPATMLSAQSANFSHLPLFARRQP